MKSRLITIGIAALFLSACSTGSYVTSSYTDDIYFNPGDVPPPISAESNLTDKPLNDKEKEKSGEKMIISQIEKNDDGTNTMNNYIFDGTKQDADALHYNMDQMDLQNSDTTVYYDDDEMKYVINNYYDGDNVDFGYRIHRFYDPFFYDPFYWDSWYYDPFYSRGGYYGSYYPGLSLGWNIGWYDPFYSWNWGYPYYGWGNPYYSWGYYPSYAWGGGYYSGYNSYPLYGKINSDNFRYGRRTTETTDIDRSASRRNTSTTVAAPQAVNRSVTKSGDIESRRSTQNTNVSAGRTANQADNSSAILTEKRRTTAADNTRSTDVKSQNLTRSSQSYTRPGTTVQSRNYTRPSTTTNKSYTTPRVVTKSANTSNYTAPKTTSSSSSSYRTNSTYIRSSSSGSSSRAYRTPTSSSGVQSYSAPSRSNYSSGSSSVSGGSSSYSSGSSGVSRSSSSGGSSGSSSRSSGGGRR